MMATFCCTRLTIQDRLKQIQAKLANKESGGLTQRDIKDLQHLLYQDFQFRQNEKERNDPTHKFIGREGTHVDTLGEFINSDPKIAGMFFDKDGKQDMNLVNIDNEGKGKPGHWVVDMKTASGGATAEGQDGGQYNAVYDPWKRAGGQVTTNAGNARLFDAYMNTNTGSPVDIRKPGI